MTFVVPAVAASATGSTASEEGSPEARSFGELVSFHEDVVAGSGLYALAPVYK